MKRKKSDDSIQDQLIRAAKNAERILNDAHAAYEQNSSRSLAYNELKLLFAIFNFELAFGVKSFVVDGPDGFARKVAAKDIVHKMYEFAPAMTKAYMRRLVEISRSLPKGLIQSIDEGRVMGIVESFLRTNLKTMTVMRDIGRAPAEPAAYKPN